MTNIKELLETGENLTREFPTIDLYASEMRELFERGFQTVTERNVHYKDIESKMSDVCFHVMSHAYTLGIARGYTLGTEGKKGT